MRVVEVAGVVEGRRQGLRRDRLQAGAEGREMRVDVRLRGALAPLPGLRQCLGCTSADTRLEHGPELLARGRAHHLALSAPQETRVPGELNDVLDEQLLHRILGIHVGYNLRQHVLVGGAVLAREQHHVAQLLGESRLALAVGFLGVSFPRNTRHVSPTSGRCDAILAELDPESLASSCVASRSLPLGTLFDLCLTFAQRSLTLSDFGHMPF
ncbi:MAG TPA: hypothetical protein VG758_02245, partial [Hyphomicrobiaceae bacterium]|nr:hypothetical protein [Hyphomicrobiaceae bacterium]